MRDLPASFERHREGRSAMEAEETFVRVKRCIQKVLAQDKGSLWKIRPEEASRR